jgi:hypothetical protein
MNMRNPMMSRKILSATAVVLLQCCIPGRAAETLPPDVSEIVRSMGELRDLTWGRLNATRKSYASNEAALVSLNDHYIEASAAANSLIDQIIMDAKFAKAFTPDRYNATAGRVKKSCDAFYSEAKQLTEAALPKQRGKPEDVSKAVVDNAAKAVGVVDNVIGLIVKQRKSLRDLKAPQVEEFCKALAERKWNNLDGSSAAPEKPRPDSESRTNKLPAAKPTASNP